MSYLSRCFFFLKDKYIDSLIKANVKQNYQKSWNLYKKNPESKIPTFHKIIRKTILGFIKPTASILAKATLL